MTPTTRSPRAKSASAAWPSTRSPIWKTFSPASISVTLTSNDVLTNADVGYATTASIGDTIFNDLDGDGVQDPGEPGLPGVIVELFDGVSTITVTTGASGDYVFSGLTPGDYSVSVDATTLPAGAFPTTSSTPVDVTVSSDQIVDSGADERIELGSIDL